MYSSDARMVRGLSIAVIVLSSLAIAGMLVVMFFLGVGGAALNDPYVLNEIATIDSDPAVVDELNRYDMDSRDVAALGSFAIGLGVVLTLGSILCSAVTLVAGILGIRRYGQPDKIGAAFGWSIAGAIAALLTGRIVTVVLLVVMAVYLNRLRNPVQPAYLQPGYYAPQPYPGQPYAGQPYPPQVPQQPAPQAPQPPVPPAPPEQQ
ncbi:hypothetical protein [Arabiibacter massiliensis]|uniref:hypothetical protein n=1 Tax=Arabiibacter massiliensis TaxID=1870985 RepID=UPI001179DD92|nr:hypothetical protein [Arabiibacter massiliensis]